MSFPPRVPGLRRLRALLSGVLALVAWAAAASPSVVRELPAHFIPGTPFAVTVTSSPDATTGVYAVLETLPDGWTAGSISHGGVFDPAARTVRWGPFLETPALARALTYQATSPADATDGSFAGSGQFDASTVFTAGDFQVARFPGSLARTLPAFYVPGQALTVSLAATPAPDVEAFAVEEVVPAGWAVAAISDAGEFDAASHKVKWGPFFGSPPASRTLTFQLTPPAAARDTAVFDARAVFDAVLVGATGPASLPVQPSRVTPTAPATFQPSAPMAVQLAVAPAVFVGAYSIETTLPEGWDVSAVSHGGVHDAVNHRLKWGPFADAVPQARTLAFTLTPDALADGDVTLVGNGIFDAAVVAFGVPLTRFRVNAESSVVSTLAPEYAGGVPLPVSLLVTPRDGTEVVAVEDTVPEGWSVEAGSISDGGTFDLPNRKVKWGPFFGAGVAVRTLGYRAVPPADASGTVQFAGTGWFGDVIQVINGQRTSFGPAGRVSRTLTTRYLPGVSFKVSLDAAPAGGTDAFAVEEEVPVGWTFESATEGGQFDARTRRIKWGPFSDRVRRTLVYRIVPPSGVGAVTTFDGSGFFQHSSIGTSGDTAAVLNRFPSASNFAAVRVPGQPFKASALAIAAAGSDPDGDFLQVISVASLSTHGAAVRLSWPWVFYTPTPAYDGPDDVEFTLGDGFGGTATARLNITVTPPAAASQNIVGIATEAGGARRLTFVGIPGFTYHIEASADLFSWLRLADRTAGPTGQFEYIDTDAPSFPTRYYRTLWP